MLLHMCGYFQTKQRHTIDTIHLQPVRHLFSDQNMALPFKTSCVNSFQPPTNTYPLPPYRSRSSWRSGPAPPRSTP